MEFNPGAARRFPPTPPPHSQDSSWQNTHFPIRWSVGVERSKESGYSEERDAEGGSQDVQETENGREDEVAERRESIRGSEGPGGGLMGPEKRGPQGHSLPWPLGRGGGGAEERRVCSDGARCGPCDMGCLWHGHRGQAELPGRISQKLGGGRRASPGPPRKQMGAMGRLEGLRACEGELVGAWTALPNHPSGSHPFPWQSLHFHVQNDTPS